VTDDDDAGMAKVDGRYMLAERRSIPERLAVVESHYLNIQADVSEIKSDVKALARSQSALATDLATKTASIAADLATKTTTLATNLAVSAAADAAIGSSRASNGVWVRAVVPWFIAGVGAAATLLAVTGVIRP